MTARVQTRFRSVAIGIALIVGVGGCAHGTSPQECSEKDDQQERVLLTVWPVGVPVDSRDFGACDPSGDPLAIDSTALNAAELARVKAAMIRDGWVMSDDGEMTITRGGRDFIATFLDGRFLAVNQQP